MNTRAKPRLTYKQAFNILADLVTLIDKTHRETITSQSTMSRAVFRQFNILLRTGLKPEPRVADMVWNSKITLDELVRQLDLEDVADSLPITVDDKRSDS